MTDQPQPPHSLKEPDTLKTTAGLWGSWLQTVVSPFDVSMMLALAAVARAHTHPDDAESYIECAALLALAAEMVAYDG